MKQNRFKSYIAWVGTICTLLNSYISHNNLEIFGISENTSKIVVWILGFIGILASFNNPEKKGEI